MTLVGCALRGVTICHPAGEFHACVLPRSPPIVETAVDGEPWSAGLTRIAWIPAWSVGVHQPTRNRFDSFPLQNTHNSLFWMGLFPWTSAMASRLFHLLHVFLILESSWGKLMSEDLGEATRQVADVAPALDHRVFAHESANRDMVSINMFKVYEKYSKEPLSQRDGNTVRSFKAVPGEWKHEFSSINCDIWFIQTKWNYIYCWCFARR